MGEREPAPLLHASWGRRPACFLADRRLATVSPRSLHSRYNLTLGLSVLKLVGEGLSFALGKRLDESQCLVKLANIAGSFSRFAHVFTADGLDHIIWRSTQKFRNDGELVHVVLAGEERLALKHLSKDAACTPDIDLDIVLLPCEHDLRGSVVSGRDVTRHLRVLYTGETEVANLEIAVLVDEDVAGLQVAVHDTSRVDVFQTALFMSARFLGSLEFCYTPKSGRGSIG
jgi:hypothetical protein